MDRKNILINGEYCWKIGIICLFGRFMMVDVRYFGWNISLILWDGRKRKKNKPKNPNPRVEY